ncbi:hypothetical protein AVEN_172985-1 [Araneus ventricosus]|uniref:Uncharacterized protein n=1 Tax=Araneus ventricosus TaxID=182803 RepID=A0A4Y2DHI5_ARAVE|nr:hypothetical protein AVEN_172985-1 [Araneus ventricosus]
MEDGEEWRERCRCYCLGGKFLSIGTLSMKPLSGVISLLGLLALGPVQSQWTHVAHGHAYEIRVNSAKPQTNCAWKKSSITEVNENRSIIIQGVHTYRDQ